MWKVMERWNRIGQRKGKCSKLGETYQGLLILDFSLSLDIKMLPSFHMTV